MKKEEGKITKKEEGNLRDWLKLRLRFDNMGRCVNAYEVISERDTLIQAYLGLKSIPGNMTKGPDKETLDGINQR